MSHDPTQTTAETVAHFTVGATDGFPPWNPRHGDQDTDRQRGPRDEGAASVDCLFALWTETTQANAVEAGKKTKQSVMKPRRF